MANKSAIIRDLLQRHNAAGSNPSRKWFHAVLADLKKAKIKVSASQIYGVRRKLVATGTKSMAKVTPTAPIVQTVPTKDVKGATQAVDNYAEAKTRALCLSPGLKIVMALGDVTIHEVAVIKGLTKRFGLERLGTIADHLDHMDLTALVGG